MTLDAITITRQYDHPIDTVWNALTDPRQLAQWFPTAAAFDAREGGSYRFDFVSESQPEMTHARTGEVLEFEPPRVLAYSWQMEGAPTTTVRYTLAPAGDSATELTLVHDGWADGMETPRTMHDQGWNMFLQNLANLLGGDGEDLRVQMFGAAASRA